MKKLTVLFMAITLLACGTKKVSDEAVDDFDYVVDQFADVQILRYQVPGFEELSLQQREMIFIWRKHLLKGAIFCLIKTTNTTSAFVVRSKLFIQTLMAIKQVKILWLSNFI
jgi:hypothetical protein